MQRTGGNLRYSTRSIGLGVALLVYIVCDVLLTPVARFETRPVSHGTAVGFVVLGLLFAGLVLAVLSIVMLIRRSARASTLAIIAALLYLPAVIAEQTGHFSSLRAPAAGVILAMADRAREASDHRHFWWRPPRPQE